LSRSSTKGGHRKSVLIVGQQPDPHIETVRDILIERDVEVLLLNRHRRDSITVGCSGEEIELSYEIDSKRIDLAAVDSVWWRLKPATSAEFSGGTASQEEAFRWHEWRHLLSALPFLLPRAKWVNEQNAHVSASKKIRQLLLAKRVGLRIPDTIITNSARDCLPLFEKHKRVIYKTLSSFLIPPDKIIFTTEVTREDVLADEDAIALAPCLFQGYVEKSHEVRVTIVGSRVFTIRIDSQEAVETKIDWRRDQARQMYSLTELTPDTERRLLEFHRRAGLSYGAYDFIVRPNGEEVFVECNPGGQWLWLERATGCAISEELAVLLTT
jgi:hypothetical protein